MSLNLFVSGGVAASSGFSPAQISGLYTWLDADDSSTITESGGAVSMWSDKSGNAKNATQGVASKQLLTGGNINGLNALVADGIDDTMVIPNVALDKNMTLFVVWDYFDASNLFCFIEHSPDANFNNGFYLYGGTLWSCLMNRGGSTISFDAGANWQGNLPSVSMMRADGTVMGVSLNSTAYLNSTNISTLSNTLVTDNLYILSRNQGSFVSKGSLGEIVLYNRFLDNTEADQVMTYLRTKWGI